MPILSVIIPTYNRPDSLMNAVENLQNQSLTSYEIIVVDNLSDNNMKDKIHKFNQKAKFPVKYIREPKLGLHFARHAGVKEAKADLLVFTDDDTTFHPNWLKSYAIAFARYKSMVAAGGPVRPVWETTPPIWLEKILKDQKTFTILSLMELHKRFILSTKGIFFGVNMAIRKEIMFSLGGFNPEIIGKEWLGDGESGLNRKMWEKKMMIGYVPQALVYHHIPQERMTLKYFYQRMANEGASDMYSHFHKGIPSFYRLLIFFFGLLTKNLRLVIPYLYHKGRTDHYSIHIQLAKFRTQAQLRYVLRLFFDIKLRMLVLKDDWLNV